MKNAIQKAVSYLGPEFNEFLHASIGTEKNGMMLTVLSALARKNLDPWQEANQLAGLPEKTAVHRLVSLIGALPDDPLSRVALESTATRLIALLPHHINSETPSVKKLIDSREVNEFTPLILYMAFMVFLALSARGDAARHQSLVEIDNVRDVGSQQNLPNLSHTVKQ